MAAGHAGADEAVLNMLDRYGVLMLEDLITGRPDFSFAQLALAIQRPDVGYDPSTRPEEKGGLFYDTAILSESMDGGTQVAVVSAPLFFLYHGRRDLYRERCVCRSARGGRMPGHRS